MIGLLKNLRMRRGLGHAAAFSLMLMISSMVQAQSFSAQLRSPVIVYALNANGSMEMIGELPSGAVVQMPYEGLSRNPVTGRPDFQQTINRWMKDPVAMQKPQGAGIYTSTKGQDHFFPVQLNHVSGGTSFNRGDKLYFAHEDIKDSNSMYALGDRGDVPRVSRQRVAKTLSATTARVGSRVGQTEDLLPAGFSREASVEVAPRVAKTIPTARVQRTIVPATSATEVGASTTSEVKVASPGTPVSILPPGFNDPVEPVRAVSRPQVSMTLTPERAENVIAPARLAVAPRLEGHVEPRVEARVITPTTAQRIAPAVLDSAPLSESGDCVGCRQAPMTLDGVAVSANGLGEIGRAALGPESSGKATINYTDAQNPRITAGDGRRPMNEKCDRFMNSQGELGDYGRSTGRVLLQSPYKESFFKPGAMGTFCPNFDRLDQQTQLQAWIWLVGSLANEEAGCEPDTNHRISVPVTNKRGKIIRWKQINHFVGRGFLTVEKDINIRRRNGRLPECNDVDSADGQILCGISMIHKHQVGVSGKNLNNRGNFGPLSSQHGWATTKMMPHMRRFPACGAR